ncbi:MAG TPA: acyl-CoA dehydrogenase family protein [Acidimicrobiales bacterium]|jgi:alkylation response protein AidB-like acyl-CoA dehydrogenase|nr:acyl-CoA dehydrogenase family protein [Acidimicrobiales bacterium]
MTTIEHGKDLLTDEMLQRFDERAASYDRENRFFDEDWAELQASGYLTGPLPIEMGGSGLGLAEVNRLQRRLAYHAAATALGVNMHVYWVGLAADLRRMGVPGGDWILAAAADGQVLAAGHGETGNDVPVLLSSAKAERVDGGWEITAHKIFGSLTPVWTYLGVHAMDTSDPATPQIVHGFLHRDAPRYHIEETWDVLGMRATASHDTILDRAFIPDEHVAMVCPAGFAGAGPFHVALFAWALLGFAAVYLGVARRAFDEVVQQLPRRTSVALTRSMAYHPEVQHMVADMRIALEAAEAHLDKLCDDWTNGVDHGMDWPVKILAGKHAVVTQAWSVVDTALDVSGGSGIFKRTRLEQLVRECRLGRIHPGNPMFTHEAIGKLSLGISPDEQPRWG